MNLGLRVAKRAIIFVRKLKDILLWKFDSYEARLFFVKQQLMTCISSKYEFETDAAKSCILNGVF